MVAADGPVVSDYIARMHALSDELMALCAVALGLPAGFFAPFLGHPTYGVNLNRYPRPRRARRPSRASSGSGRTPISARSSCSTGSPGRGGLQVSSEGTWADAPFDPAPLTVHIGGLRP